MCSQESNLGWCKGIQHWVVQGHSGAKKVTVKVSVHIRHAAIIHELPCNGECIRITRFEHPDSYNDAFCELQQFFLAFGLEHF